MAIFKKIWGWLEPIGVSIIKANNAKYAPAIDIIYGAIKEKNYDVIPTEVANIVKAKIEEDAVEDTEEPVGGMVIPIDVTKWNGYDYLDNADWSFFNPKYFSITDIYAAPKTCTITNNNPRMISFDSKVFVRGKTGHFSVAIMKDNTVRLAGHGGNAHNVGLTKEDYIPNYKDIQAYFLVITNFEGNPRGALEVSQIKEI